MSIWKRGSLIAAITALVAALIIATPALLPRSPLSVPQPVAEADDPAPADDPATAPEGTEPEADDGGDPFVDPFIDALRPWRVPPWGPRPGTPSPTPTPTPTPTDPPTGPLTIVSLTFDDGTGGQTLAADLLDAHGVDATFFVNSGTIGLGGYLSLADLQSLAANGHEIGGHTVTHPDLTGLPADEVKRQICDDRAQLLAWGFDVRNFAYPFASTNDEVEAAVASCGYNSARMLGDIASRFGCPECDSAETVPPADPYYTRALDQFDSTWTLQDLKDGVTNAEATGGWVQYTFHDVCTTSCGPLSISVSMFDQFLEWLSDRGSTVNTVVETVGDVIGGPVQPAVDGPAVPPPPPSGSNGIVNPSLEELGGNGVPRCWYHAPYGTNSPSFGVTAGHTGDVASRIEMSGYENGDAKILPVFDLGACAPSVMPGESYSLRAWYTSTVVTQFAVYLRTNGGGWTYWTSSPWFHAASEFTEAEWTTGPIPAGYNGISFGLNIFDDGVLVTDDYAIYNSVGAPAVSRTATPFALLDEPPVDGLGSESTNAPPADGADGGESADPPAGEPPVSDPPVDPPASDPPAGIPPAIEPETELPPAEPPAEVPPDDPPADDPPPADPLASTLGEVLTVLGSP